MDSAFYKSSYDLYFNIFPKKVDVSIKIYFLKKRYYKKKFKDIDELNDLLKNMNKNELRNLYGEFLVEKRKYEYLKFNYNKTIYEKYKEDLKTFDIRKNNQPVDIKINGQIKYLFNKPKEPYLSPVINIFHLFCSFKKKNSFLFRKKNSDEIIFSQLKNICKEFKTISYLYKNIEENLFEIYSDK